MSAKDARGHDRDTAVPGQRSEGTASAGSTPATPRRTSWIRRHRALASVLVVTALVLGACSGWLYYLNQQIGNVPRVALDLEEDRRPDKVGGDAAESLNILLAGVDAGNAMSIEEAVDAEEWPAYSHRSDTIIVLHVTADRDEAYLVSIPRDSWVQIEGLGMSKVNAAFAAGGPSLYVSTIEALTGLRMDHLAMIDWEGFRDLTRAIGGVPVTIPEDIYDPKQDVQWKAGEHNLEGEEALQYVRMRYGLENGDYDRIARQQNFLRAFMRKMLSNGTTSNPVKLTNAVEAIVRYLTVDESFDNAEMRSLALSLRALDTDDVTFVTLPTRCCETIDGQSVVRVKRQQAAALFEAVGNDDIEAYFEKYGREGVLEEQSEVR